MSGLDIVKLVPRNVAALRKGQDQSRAARPVVGNPVSTRLESGVGNCFPGLEFDLRNLERRFFPFLEVDILDNRINIVSADIEAIKAEIAGGGIPSSDLEIYQEIDADAKRGRQWAVEELRGTFGALGNQNLQIAELRPPTQGTNKQPPDAWTAIRMLPEGSDVTLGVRKFGGRRLLQLQGKRARYLDDNGALAAIFLPGELTQSLCSPWTHDFRDCGCFYWAANHPDIATPPLPVPPPTAPGWNSPVPWEREDRSLNVLPAPATSQDPTGIELDHYDINLKWQTLNFVLDGREQVAPYVPGQFSAPPLASQAELIQNLRYAAGVELAVAQEYLAAAFSLRDPATLPGKLGEDVIAANAELMRIAIGEMRHLRLVNDVLALFAMLGPFKPALQIATQLPLAKGGFRNIQIGPADQAAILRFIDIERPSLSVDGLYSRILATLDTNLGNDAQRRAIRLIMAEGEDHFETFQFIQQWLSGHDEKAYLRSAAGKIPGKNNKLHTALQQQYRTLLDNLYVGYSKGIPDGAPEINKARNTMVLPGGIDDAADAVAGAGFIVAFDLIEDDPRFGVISPP
jgi:ferritin-like protein